MEVSTKMLKNRLIWVLLNFSHYLQPRLMSQPSDIFNGGKSTCWSNKIVYGSTTKLIVSKSTIELFSFRHWMVFIVAIQNETQIVIAFGGNWRRLICFFLQLWRNKIIDEIFGNLNLHFWPRLFSCGQAKFNRNWHCL